MKHLFDAYNNCKRILRLVRNTELKMLVRKGFEIELNYTKTGLGISINMINHSKLPKTSFDSANLSVIVSVSLQSSISV